MNSYTTHQDVLKLAVANTTGDVLELGVGEGSTPLLHNIVLPPRQLLSLENNRDWFLKYTGYTAAPHVVSFVENWDTFWAFDRDWGLAFVDHAPGERRAGDILRLRDKAKVIVIHDTEAACYNYEPSLSLFAYRRDFKSLVPWTTVVSNIDPLDWVP